MALGDDIANTGGAIESLVVLADHLRSVEREVLGQIYATPPEACDALAKALLEALDDDDRPDQKSPDDPMSMAETRERLIGLAHRSDLPPDLAWWVMAHAIAANTRVAESRLKLLTHYYQASGRQIGDHRFLLRPGDPIPASVFPSAALPGAARVDNYHGIRFVPPEADQINVVFDLSLAKIIDKVFRAATDGPASNRRRPPNQITTAHPFLGKEYRHGPTTARGWAFPSLPLPENDEERVARLDRALAAAVDRGAPVVVFPESIGTRAEVERLIEAWRERTDAPGLLVAGSFHETTERGRMSVALIAGRMALDQAEDSVDEVVEITKNHPVGGLPGVGGGPIHGTHRIKPGHREDIDITVPAQVTMLAGSTKTLSVLICKDAIDPALTSLVSELSCDLLIVPAFTPMTEPFEVAAASISTLHNGRFLLANGVDRRVSTVVTGPAVHKGDRLVTRVTQEEPGIALIDFANSENSQWEPIHAVHAS